MRILLISNYRPDRQQSMLRYPRMLERALRGRGHEVTVIHPPAVAGRLPFPGKGIRKWIRYIDKYLIAPLYLRPKARGYDVVHICDHSNAMYLPCAGSTPCVITCHDLIGVLSGKGYYPEVRPGRGGSVLQDWIVNSLKQSRYVVCISGKTAGDLRALVPECRAKVRVIPHALNRRCEPACPEEIEQQKRELGIAADAQYLLHVGAEVWYKNRLGAMRIFAELRKLPEFAQMHLVMAGHPFSSEMRKFAEASGSRSWLIEAANVDDKALNALYTGAAALLYPSLAEGFGWPILEALASGCVVITTNRAPMNEIGGEAAIYIDPTDPATAAKVIAQQWSERSVLREAGFRKAATFTEKKMIDSYVQVYEEIAAGAAAGREAPLPIGRN